MSISAPSSPTDILILSNGPGEVTTWVRPVVRALRQELGDDREKVRISVILSPCPNASGKEAQIALAYPEVDRVQAAEDFLPFLLWGKTKENWEWRHKGVVVFLGGDQFFPIVIGKRLGYRTVIYAEWDARWHNLLDRFGVMKPEVMKGVAPKYTHKFAVVGDLMAEAGKDEFNHEDTKNRREVIGLLPGSKGAKLAQGVPLTLAAAEYIHAQRPQTRFVIPVAPTLDLATLARFADAEYNPMVKVFGDVSVELVAGDTPMLKTSAGLCVELYQQHPAYDVLRECSICLTTVGANTAELGSLGVPMLVLLPTQQLDAMRAWNGIPGILVNLPLVGSGFAKFINWQFLRRKGLLAWPNIWAQAEVVPELVGKLEPQALAAMVLDYLEHPDKLEVMREKLRSVRGNAGAAQKLAQIVVEELGVV